ncbi:hypothetical protein F7725_012037 [Dissostichus mawsoni]|uniref:Acyl-CoA thioesterase 11 n=1 Tax=Dissostichus mawsoni TaxID=36200 RepID=A0A7J5ZAU2_DISMA|nr:hypothetical protein F7725_012037 [Dissostichus mawsoni]
MSQIVMPCHSNHRQELSVGQLLKWIDSSACLSGDVGQVVNIKAKVILKPVVPHTEKEQVEYSVAAERRRVRMLHDDIIKDLLSHGSVLQADNTAVGNAVAAEKTKVESVELVLPPMLTISRLCQAHPTLRTIDMFTFRGPSQVGDRLLLRAIVNNAFKNSMEVGVRAEAYHEAGPNRHINSAFMTFEVLDDHRKLCTLPRIRPEPLEGERRFQEAIARKKIRLDRKYIISQKQGEVPLSVPWDPRNQVSDQNHSGGSATKTCAVRLFTLEHKSMLSFRVESEVDVPAHRAFRLLAEMSDRPSWDPHYQNCELIYRVDDDDFLYRVVTPSVRQGGLVPRLQPNQEKGFKTSSCWLPRGSRVAADPYVIALRSVSLPTHPPTEGYNRGEVLCAGFTILETKDNMSLVSYYNQASPEVIPYISTDIAGLSSTFYHTFSSCSQYLAKNRLQSASEEPTGPDQTTNTDSLTWDAAADGLSAPPHSTQL